MTAKQENATKIISFRNNENDFQVQLKVVSKNGKVVSIPDSTETFFNFLKKISVVSPTTEIYSWLNSGEELSITLITSSNISSRKIRRQANILGLTIIPGQAFQKKKEADLERANQKTRSIQQLKNK